MQYDAVKTGPDDEPGIDETIALVVRHGGKVLVGKSEIPGVGHYAIFAATEDNTFSNMQNL